MHEHDDGRGMVGAETSLAINPDKILSCPDRYLVGTIKSKCSRAIAINNTAAALTPLKLCIDWSILVQSKMFLALFMNLECVKAGIHVRAGVAENAKK